MAVVYLYKSNISSNKHKGDNPGKDKVSYIYKGKNGAVRVLVPKIDKLTVTCLPLKAKKACQEFDHLIPRIIKLYKNKGVISPLPQNKRVRGYKYQCWIGIPGSSEQVLLQAHPEGNPQATRYFRYEFNPDRLGASGIAGFKKRLTKLFGPEGDYATILEGALTRVDVAVDLINVPIDQLVVISSKGGRKRHAYFADHGPVETIYLHMTKGEKSSRFYAYNRKQKEIDYENNDAKAWPDVTRLEFRVPTIKLAFGSLRSIENPLGKMRVIDLWSVEPGLDPSMWGLFIDACNLRGPEKALETLPENLRLACSEALKAGEAVWRPAKLWLHWQKEIQVSGLLDSAIIPKTPTVKKYGKPETK